MKKLLSMILVLCLMVSMMPMMASASTTQSGTWGNLNWVLDDDGTLTISGEGEMEDFSYSGRDAWRAYEDDIRKVIIEDSITSIGEAAFSGCSGLTSITIPDSVTSIRYRTFYQCSSLTSITIPDSVTSIGSYAFYYCSSLTSITIPDSVTSIGDRAFFGCSSLTSITIPDSVTSIGEAAFLDCDSLTSITIPDSVTSIGDGAFYGCNRLTSIRFKGSEPVIGSDAFKYVTATAYFPAGDASWNDVINYDYGGDITWVATWGEPGHIHKYTDTVTAPTCTDEGYAIHTCGCGYSYEEYIDALGHKTVTDDAVAATCTEDGLSEGSHCEVCGEILVQQKTVPATGEHSWDEGKVTTEPTEESEGVKTFTCISCEETKTEVLDKLDHVHNYSKDETHATCLEDGKIVYTCRCGHSYTETQKATGHKWDEGKVTKEPAAGVLGEKAYNCSECGIKGTQSIPYISPTAGTELIEAIKKYEAKYGAVAFNNSENIASISLQEDGRTVEFSIIMVQALRSASASMSFDSVNQDVDFEYDGTIDYRSIFSDCLATVEAKVSTNAQLYNPDSGFDFDSFEVTDYSNRNFTESLDVKANTNGAISQIMSFWDVGLESIGAPSLSQLGFGAGYYPIVPDTNPKPEHEHSYTATVTAPTCTEEGYTTHTCSCGDSYTDSTVAATGHKWDEGKVTKEPTEEAEGEKTFTCSVCGETRKENIDKVDHVHSYVESGYASTCTEDGNVTYTCSCGHSYTETQKASGHKWDEGRVTVKPSDGVLGEKTYICSACGAKGIQTISNFSPTAGADLIKAIRAEGVRNDSGQIVTTNRISFDGKKYTVSIDLMEDGKTVCFFITENNILSHMYFDTSNRDVELNYKFQDSISSPSFGYISLEYGKKTNAELYDPSTGFILDVIQYRISDNYPEADYEAEANAYVNKCMQIWDAGLKKIGAPSLSELGFGAGTYPIEVEDESKQEPKPEPEDKPDDPKPVDNPFKDVAENAYYFEPVMWAVGKGVTSGLSADSFGPSAGCTRAQVVTFLWRAAGEPAPKSSTNPFKDVKEGVYYYNAVLWAVENGITTGLSADSFGPNANCNRGQIVTFLWRAKGKPAPTNSDNPFIDVPETQYYYDAVLWAVEKGITTGLSADSFGPNSTCTRGQIVTFLYRAYK